MDKLWRQVISKVYDPLEEALKVTGTGGGGGGSATEAKQDIGNASLASIDTKLTNPIPVTGTFFQATQPVSLSSIPLASGASTAAKQDTGNASLASIDSKLTNPLPVSGPLTDTELRASAVPVSAASLPLPSGASTSANQVTANASLSSIDSKLTSPLAVTGTFFQATQPVSGTVAVSNFPSTQAVTGPLTDTQLRATPVPVSGTFFQATQPISAAALPLPSGASTAANQSTGNASLASIDSKLTSPLAVTGTFFQATQPVSVASLPLPTGAATSANQTTANASLSSIDSKLTSPLTVSLPSGAATAANQTSEIAQLTAINAGVTDVISTGNSTTTPLGSAGVFTGTGVDTLGYGYISVGAISNVTGSFVASWSHDNVTWYSDVDTYDISASVLKGNTWGAKLRYFRITFTNGGTAQASFTLQTILRARAMKPSSHKASEAFTDSTDLEGVKAVISAKRLDGTYENARLTNSNNLKTSLEEFNVSVASSSVNRISASVTAVTIFAANTAAKGRYVYNNSTADMYLKLGASASTTDFTILIAGALLGKGGFYEIPPVLMYNGIVTAVWASATGAAQATEVS